MPTITDLVVLKRAFAYATAQNPEVHPHISLYDLSEELQILIGKFIFNHMDERDRKKKAGEKGGEIDDNDLYLIVLDYFGVDCPHCVRSLQDERYCSRCGSLLLEIHSSDKEISV